MALPKATPSEQREEDREPQAAGTNSVPGDEGDKATEDQRDDRDTALREKQREMIQSLDLSKYVYSLDTLKLLIAHQDAHLQIGMPSINVMSTGRLRKPRFRSLRRLAEPRASRR